MWYVDHTDKCMDIRTYVRMHRQNFQLNTLSLASVGLAHTHQTRSCVGKIFYITLASRMIV